MIAYLEGTVLTLRKDSIVLKVNGMGIGFEVFVFNASTYTPNELVSLYCYQQFKEDGQVLYGFQEEEQYQLFTLLIQVKGLGCKTVLNALSAMDCQDIIRAIENADAATLKKLPGIGAKTAGQIILDLKGKIVLSEPKKEKEEKKAQKPNPVYLEVCEALLSLGFKQVEIDGLNLDPNALMDQDPSVILQSVLRKLAAQKRRTF
ncbi:MAG: Holliday junction branch migration protein RuvA [Allobaculum sp.]|nr:Holliday junction branch migration protein RuvA [Allobaculum sp.]